MTTHHSQIYFRINFGSRNFQSLQVETAIHYHDDATLFRFLFYVLYTVSLQNTPSIHHLNLILRLKLHEIELKLQFRCLFRSERGLPMSTRKRYTSTMNIHFPFLSIELLEITDVSNFKYTRDSTIVNIELQSPLFYSLTAFIVVSCNYWK